MKVGMSIDIEPHTKKVVIAFEKPIDHIKLSPQNAQEFAYAIFEKARLLEDNRPDIIIAGGK